MKLFDTLLNDIRTFGLRIKQFLSASNIEYSDILETSSYFDNLYQRTENCAEYDAGYAYLNLEWM